MFPVYEPPRRINGISPWTHLSTIPGDRFSVSRQSASTYIPRRFYDRLTARDGRGIIANMERISTYEPHQIAELTQILITALEDLGSAQLRIADYPHFPLMKTLTLLWSAGVKASVEVDDDMMYFKVVPRG